MTKGKPISQQLAEKTFKELGLNPKTGKPLPVNSRTSPLGSHTSPSFPQPPFRIPSLEKTKRQASSTQGYKASATWQTASLLRDLFTLWFESLPPVSPANLPLFSRLKAQVLDALRSVVSTIEEGWGRPTTKELLDFIGFSQGSLAEVRGNLERMLADGLIPSSPVDSHNSDLSRLGIPTPSKTNPYPPLQSRIQPGKYGSLRVRLREYTGKILDSKDFTYDLFLELINKTDYLLKRSVEGLQNKIILDEKKKLSDDLSSHWRKYW